MIQLIVSVILYFVIFFGISFIINMLLRRTWLMTFVYPFIVLLIVGDSKLSHYFTQPIVAFSSTFSQLVHIQIYDVIILASGLLGAVVSGFVIKILRKTGYQMF